MIEGYKTFAVLPLEEDYCIYHNKQIQRQEEQNARYSQIQQQLNK